MLYSLFEYLKDQDLPGARLMDYITFRSGVAFILALLISTIIGSRIIRRLQLMQIGEIVRDLDLEGQMSKKVPLQWAESLSSYRYLFRVF